MPEHAARSILMEYIGIGGQNTVLSVKKVGLMCNWLYNDIHKILDNMKYI